MRTHQGVRARPLPLLVMLGAWQFMSTSGALAQCIGYGDADVNHVVDLSDFSEFAKCLSGPENILSKKECDPQVALIVNADGDDDVDLRDYSRFATAFLREYFDYGPHRADPEAERLAMQISPELRAPDDVYERVRRDLAIMRANYADLQWASDTPDFEGDRLLVRLVSPADHEMFDQWTAFLLVTRDYSNRNDPGLHFLAFCDNLNIPALVRAYEQLDEVQYAGPSFLICLFGCCVSQIELSESSVGYHYKFFYPANPEDCSGCYRTRVLDVDEAGSVAHISCSDSCLAECP